MLYPYRVRKDIGLAYGIERSLALSLNDMRSHDLISTVGSQIESEVKIQSQISIEGSTDRKGFETRNRWAYSGKYIKFEICYIYDLEWVSCVIYISLLKWFNDKTYVNALISHIGAEGVMKIHIYTYDHGRTDGRLIQG